MALLVTMRIRRPFSVSKARTTEDAIKRFIQRFEAEICVYLCASVVSKSLSKYVTEFMRAGTGSKVQGRWP